MDPHLPALPDSTAGMSGRLVRGFAPTRPIRPRALLGDGGAAGGASGKMIVRAISRSIGCGHSIGPDVSLDGNLTPSMRTPGGEVAGGR
jgi:hypothetical protein